MSFASSVRLLLRHWILIGLITLLVGAGVYAVSTTRTPLYTATASQYFTVSVGDSAAELAQGSNYVQDQMASFGQLATSPAVLNPVIDDLGLTMTVKELARSIRITTPRNTVVMQIAVANANAETAAAIANSVGSQLGNAVDTVGPKLPSGRSLVTVQSIQTALPPTVQSSPDTRRNTALGLLVGLLLATGIVLARARMDNRVHSPAALAEITDEPVLGAIRHAANLQNRALVVIDDADSRSAEDIRHLRSSIEQLAGGRSSFALAVTSSVRDEGRSTIAANLAAALGEAGRRVVLVDGDLRRPRVAEITRTDGGTGLLTVLGDPTGVAGTVQAVRNGHFDVLTAGGTSANPTEVLASPALAALMGELRSRYEFVVVDTPAVLAVADVTALRGQVDGAVLVADASSVRRPQLQQALDTADVAGLTVLGVVLNEVADRELPATSGYTGTESRRTRQSDKGAARASRRSSSAVSWDAPSA
ncbi:polysaccharide biosynthesis tyrosine autokinase [Microlunatus capsulatus]|uniref:Capsular exopolysaccharide synthesis family protein n=1 Tax=Microlunatus capsulatus TaxID=99117 RepID=A0ABS4Z9N8_9ACTN|nr:polysaccharide biosynthesis tyrosine autokinase [Microlunatus capsulatus]MBP2417709.1 capsular exopolysaccharide synthesis family protein [Microlunatus capsulatus]